MNNPRNNLGIMKGIISLLSHGIHSKVRGEMMGIIWNDSRLFFLPVLGHHRENLERDMYTKQSLRMGRLA